MVIGNLHANAVDFRELALADLLVDVEVVELVHVRVFRVGELQSAVNVHGLGWLLPCRDQYSHGIHFKFQSHQSHEQNKQINRF